MKKIVYLSALILILSLSAMLFGCGDVDTGEGSNSSTDSVTSTQSSNSEATDSSQPHEHIYDKGWNKEDTGHYRPCICHPEHKNISAHIDTVDKNGLCDVCQYEMEKEKTVTVIVQDTDGKAVQGAEIKIYTQTVEHIVKTDENGSCTGIFIYTNGARAMIISLPEGYKLPQKTIFSIYESSLTITVEKQ